MTKANQSKKEVTFTRIFDAPRELVFKAWTDPKLMAQWWGPNGFTNPVCELDARSGGTIRIDMIGPDGTVYPMKDFMKSSGRSGSSSPAAPLMMKRAIPGSKCSTPSRSPNRTARRNSLCMQSSSS